MTDIVERMLDLHEQATKERSHYYVGSCVRDAIGEIEALRADIARAVENHTADLARLAEAEALRKDAERWRELESVGRQYRFPSIWGGTVWRDSSNDYNGSRYTETREIFARRKQSTPQWERSHDGHRGEASQHDIPASVAPALRADCRGRA